MIVEGAGWRKKTQKLSYTEDAAVSTHFTGSYHSAFRIGEDNIPARLLMKSHIFHIIDQLYLNMDDAVELLTEKLEDPALEEVVAASGLRQHLGSMRPKVGGAIIDKELNAQYLTPSQDLERARPSYRRLVDERLTSVPPFVTMGTRYAQARISAYDFPNMVSYVMTNTALQHVLNTTSSQAIDPRLQLIKAAQPEGAVV